MKKIKDYEIINHEYEHSQYFQGCGTSYTEFDDVSTGIGMDAKEAYENAVEDLSSTDWDVSTLPTRPNGIRKRDKVPMKFLKNEYNEIYWYVSIRVK